MADSESVTQMIHLLRSDDPKVRDEAARLVWEHYFRDLLALAQRHIGKRIRPRVGADDLLQSAYASVCRRQLRTDDEFHDRDDFWKLLVTITLNKARNAAKHHRRARRDVGRTVALPATDDRPEGWSGEPLAAAGPPGELALMLAEELDRRIASLKRPLLKDVALKRLEGLTNREIAERLDCSERTIERKLEIIRREWGTPSEGAD